MPDSNAPAPPIESVAQQEAGKLGAFTMSAVFLRSLAIQGSWNYEQLIGNGIAFCMEPALRQLPGGVDGEAYKSALARQSKYFNSHPYLASIAIGALARVELEGMAPARIERFRTALCGPLGSVGDRLVWASWLPACSLVGLLLFGVGWSPLWVVLGFLLVYNAGHLWLRVWGLRAGWKHGIRVASALGHPILQHGPRYIGRISAVLGGLALPFAAHRGIGGGQPFSAIPIGVAIFTPLLAVLLVRLPSRVQGWLAVLILLAALVLYSVIG